jgi:hypothetical protein
MVPILNISGSQVSDLPTTYAIQLPLDASNGPDNFSEAMMANYISHKNGRVQINRHSGNG